MCLYCCFNIATAIVFLGKEKGKRTKPLVNPNNYHCDTVQLILRWWNKAGALPDLCDGSLLEEAVALATKIQITRV